jgi:hypothetical protein
MQLGISIKWPSSWATEKRNRPGFKFEFAKMKGFADMCENTAPKDEQGIA